jgi:MFS family permease
MTIKKGEEATMATPAAMTFGEAMSRLPMRPFQWAIVAVCMLVLVSDGIDMQLLGILAPLVIADFGVDRGTFGIAMSAALIGFGLGAWGGGWLGDVIGRRYTLAIAALLFAIATVAASFAGGVWSMAVFRVIGGLGFGAAYANSLAMAGEWVPERLRPVTVSTLSVGTPIGGTVVGWLGPDLAAAPRSCWLKAKRMRPRAPHAGCWTRMSSWRPNGTIPTVKPAIRSEYSIAAICGSTSASASLSPPRRCAPTAY